MYARPSGGTASCPTAPALVSVGARTRQTRRGRAAELGRIHIAARGLPAKRRHVRDAPLDNLVGHRPHLFGGELEIY